MAIFGSKKPGSEPQPPWTRPGDGTPPPSGPIRLDRTFGDPEAMALRVAFHDGNWGEVLAILEDRRDPYRHVFLVSQISSIATQRGEDRPAALDELGDSHPGSAAVKLLRGVYDTSWAWHARGAGWASTVSQEQFSVFFERLRSAEADLRAAAELEPSDPAPWVQGLITARGLELPKEELHRRFAEAEVRAPGAWPAHAAMLQGIAPKWGGSAAAMFGFARAGSARSAPGVPLHALVAIAHYETAAYMKSDVAAKQAYYADPRARAEIYHAAWRMFPEGRAPVSRPEELAAREVFAHIAGLFGLDDLALWLYRITGDVITPGIFLSAGDGWVATYQRTRDAVLARTGYGPAAPT